MKLPLSVVIIVKNEELNIERCILSVRDWVQEVLVVDSQSEDQTVAIAQKAGARTLQIPWQGFGPQKRSASMAACFDWVLSLDADEVVSPELAAEIQSQFLNLDPQIGYQIPRKSWHLRRWILHGGWYPDRQLRLFNRQHSMWNQALIHEKVICKKTEQLHGPLLHYVFRDLSHQVITNDRYSSLQAVQAYEAGIRFSWFKLFFKPMSKFLECYILKRGFLDGSPGLFIAISAAYSVFLRWAKLWEIQQNG